jgi:hypothetical protein
LEEFFESEKMLAYTNRGSELRRYEINSAPENVLRRILGTQGAIQGQ